MKIVIDTNIIASAIFFGGKPRILVEYVLNQKLDAYVTREIAEEYKETIAELISRYPSKAPLIPISQILARCKMISSTSHVAICRDPDDNKFIECALDSKCMYIVSGDNDLLSIAKYKEVAIITVADFLEKFF